MGFRARAPIGSWLLCCLFALACAPEAPPEPTAAGAAIGPPNLLLISIDTLRSGHLGSYGYERPTSPALDAFAAKGTVFRNTVSSSSWTVPAHMTMFTGLEPPAHGLIEFPAAGRLADEHTTLAELLRDAGYRTGAFTGGGFISPRFGFDAGFETYGTVGRRFISKVTPVTEWLESLPGDEPFFLFLHGFDVHRPYRPPEPFASRFVPGADPTAEPPPQAVADRLYPLLEDLALLVRDRADDGAVTRRPPEETLDLLVSQYDGEIALVDYLLGNFLGWLDRHGRLSNTVVAIVSDHGDEFYEHGAVDHVHTLYEELIQVPWILVGPGIPRAVVQDQVALLDLFPTLLEALEISHRPVQGVSRLPLARAAEGAEGASAVFGFTGFSEYPYRVESVRTPDWKLIRWSLEGMERGLHEPREHYTFLFRDRPQDFVELFRLADDPEEQHDVSAEHPEIVQALVQALDRRLEGSRDFLHAPTEAAPPDAQELEALRALGYVE